MSAKKITRQVGSAGKNGAGSLRGLPSIDRVIGHEAMTLIREELPHSILTGAARSEVEAAREVILSGGDPPSLEEIATRAARRARQIASPSLRPVINATGVIIHTNLGRAPLSDAAIEAMGRASGYSNLEYDLEAGERGSR